MVQNIIGRRVDFDPVVVYVPSLSLPAPDHPYVVPLG